MSEIAVRSSMVPVHDLQPTKNTARATAWWAIASRFWLHGLIISTWVSRIPTIKTNLRLDNAAFGLALLGTAIGSIVAVPLAGWLVTRFGSRRVVAWSTLGFSLALVGPSLTANAAQLFAALLLFGACAGANDVSINSLGVAFDSTASKPTISRLHAMFSVGGIIGAGIGGVVAGLGVAPRVHIAIASAVCLSASLFTARWLPEAADPAAARSSGTAGRLRLPPVLLILATIGFCMFLSEGAIADWSGVFLKQVLDAPAGQAAFGYAVFSAGMTVFRLLGDALTHRVGPVWTLRSGALTAAAGLSLAILAPSIVWALIGFGLTGAGLSVIVPLAFAAGGRVESVASGAGVAMVSGSGYIGFLFGPPLIGLVAQRTSLRGALLILVVLSLVAAFLAPAVRVKHTPSFVES